MMLSISFKGTTYPIYILHLLATIRVAAASDIPPAFETLPYPSPSQSGVPYFPYEKVQLTDAVLRKLPTEDANLISFAKSSDADKPTPKCKTFPGDTDWPDLATWSRFDALTAGALTKTVPLAAPCYKDWPEYDPELCEDITKNWGDPHLQ
jgi:hypothetical protein